MHRHPLSRESPLERQLLWAGLALMALGWLLFLAAPAQPSPSRVHVLLASVATFATSMVFQMVRFYLAIQRKIQMRREIKEQGYAQ